MGQHQRHSLGKEHGADQDSQNEWMLCPPSRKELRSWRGTLAHTAHPRTAMWAHKRYCRNSEE